MLVSALNLPRLVGWSLFEYEDKAVVIGVVYNHYKIPDGTVIRTSPVKSDKDNFLVTKNSVYILEVEATTKDERQTLINQHPLFCFKRGICA